MSNATSNVSINKCTLLENNLKQSEFTKHFNRSSETAAKREILE